MELHPHFLKFDEASIEENHAEVLLFGEKTRVVCASLLRMEGELLFVFRPSEIDVLEKPEENTIGGIIRRATFLGDIVDYLVEVEGETLRVQTKATKLHRGEMGLPQNKPRRPSRAPLISLSLFSQLLNPRVRDKTVAALFNYANIEKAQK